MKTAVIMPTMRKADSLENFIEIADDNIDFILLSKEKILGNFRNTTQINDQEIFSISPIFNRITKRNYGFLYAYKQNYDVIITLDDDCYPINNSYFDEHIKRLQSYDTDYFNVLELYNSVPENIFVKGTRGYPTEPNDKKYPVVLNQGLWLGDLDLPAKTIMENNGMDGKIPQNISSKFEVAKNLILPETKLLTVCEMNLAFRGEVAPIAPISYQDPDGVGINRYDDIWAGIFMKKIFDKLGKRMSVGLPLIKHNKAPRNIITDVELEAKGDKLNSFIWQNLPNLSLEGKDYISCFLEIADWLKKESQNEERKFLEKVSNMMINWIKLLDSKI